jgi:hypothetical protein
MDTTKNEVLEYEKKLKASILKLNNQNSILQGDFEQIEDKKNKLKSESQETSSKKLSKISDLARILMAIDNLETKCHNRKEKSSLKYPLSLANLEDPKNFNAFLQRSKPSLS